MTILLVNSPSFIEIFESAQPVPFNAQWNNGTGYFDALGWS